MSCMLMPSASLALVGCSYFDTGEGAALQTGKPSESIGAIDHSIYQPQEISVSDAIRSLIRRGADDDNND